MKNCVQIGLNNIAEYVYVTGAERLPTNPIHQLPEAFTDFGESWRYFGVDADVVSVATMIQKYPIMENLTTRFVCAVITGESNQTYTEGTHALRIMNSWFGEYVAFVPSLTLHELLDGLRLDEIDVLVIDIEGDELPVLKCYDWRIKPKFIAVEVHIHPHLDENAAQLKDIILPEGYRLTLEKDTNIREGIAWTRELQFIYET